MALITEIIKKYDGEAKERIAEARKLTAAKKAERESLFFDPSKDMETPTLDLNTKEPTGQDFAYFDWQNKLVDFYKKLGEVTMLLDQLNNSTGLLKEMERIRKENCDIKQKMNESQLTP
jgi:site-specific DNA-adenine methylase